MSHSVHRVFVFVILSMLFSMPCLHAQDCEPQWIENQFCFPGVDGSVLASCIYDDGSGEAVYVGGDFDVAGCAARLSGIAKWDGSTWSPLAGPSGTGVDGVVHALAVFDDGSGPALFVGGKFTFAGGVLVHNIAKWDGSQWSPLSAPGGIGINNLAEDAVYSLSTFADGAGESLYVGGRFHFAGGIQIGFGVARWDGSEWAPLFGLNGSGIGLGSPGIIAVRSLCVYDGSLYVGGGFEEVDGISVNGIARWDGAQWSGLIDTNGFDLDHRASVLSMCVGSASGGDGLYVAGVFQSAGGHYVSNIATWDGEAWSVLPSSSGIGLNGRVQSITFHADSGGTRLYAGGRFTSTSQGGIALSKIACWDGSAWLPLLSGEQGGISGDVFALTSFETETKSSLFVGGAFGSSEALSPSQSAALWEDGAWVPVVDPAKAALSGPVNAFAEFDDGSGSKLYVGGSFHFAGTTRVNNVACWDGTQWTPLAGSAGIGTSGSVEAMAVYDDGMGEALYVAGRFQNAGGILVNRIAKWDGTEWAPLPGPTSVGVATTVSNPSVLALTTYDDGNGLALYVGGYFSSAGGVNANNIAKWDTGGWSPLVHPLGQGFSTTLSLAVYDGGTGPALFAGGSFGTYGSVSYNSIGRWDGQQWHNLVGPSGAGVSPTSGSVDDLITFDDGSGPVLIVTGLFAGAGGVAAESIAHWDGVRWFSLPGSATVDLESSHAPNGNALATTYLTNPPSLFMGGDFDTADCVPVNNVLKWDGTAWSSLGSSVDAGTNNYVNGLIVFDDGSGPALFVGGAFSAAGGVASSHIAKWRLCTNLPCLPDINNDGTLSPADFSAWIAAFNAMSPACDQNADGSCTPADFSAWIANYNAGCP